MKVYFQAVVLSQFVYWLTVMGLEHFNVHWSVAVLAGLITAVAASLLFNNYKYSR
jgi:hypothetical protein